MNLNQLKAYAPQARLDFIQAMTDRAAFFGLTQNKTEPVTVKGDVAVIAGREHHKSVADKRRRLEHRIVKDGFKETMETLAYTWFNRFVAIRFMELHGYFEHGFRLLSHPEGETTPEILKRAKDVEIPGLKRDVVLDLLLEGNKEPELYRRLLVAQCNALHTSMSFLFEKIDDETELLLPDNLLNTDSLVRKLVTAIDEADWSEVEIIGWLYQFYISDKKEEVFTALKKRRRKITTEDIPAATQLFTPHWIVGYLVENSLGRLWMLNRPDSRLFEKMPYYMAPLEPETDFLRILSPEDIKICDPACGSGHILTYAFDLLTKIYQETGYAADEIAPKILANNLVGIEIDDRAGALAAFALAMKAAAVLGPKNFVRSILKPNITVLRNIDFSAAELNQVVTMFADELNTKEALQTLSQFARAKDFGSLIVPKISDPSEVSHMIRRKDIQGDILDLELRERVLAVLGMAEALSPAYHIVVVNPPYMGRGGMNTALIGWSDVNYPDSKSDLFAMFIIRSLTMALDCAYISMITMQSWMFLSSFEVLRSRLLDASAFISMAHLGERAFNTIGGSIVSTTAFVSFKSKAQCSKGQFVRLLDGRDEATKSADLRLASQGIRDRVYAAGSDDFKRIPGAPIAYWISQAIADAFNDEKLSSTGNTRRGLQTGNKPKFIRQWSEVAANRLDLTSTTRSEAIASEARWFRFNNGGAFRKWAGGMDLVVNWEGNGAAIKATGKAIIPSEDLYFRAAVYWGRISSGPEAFRWQGDGIIPGDLSPCFYSDEPLLSLAYLNTPVARAFKGVVNPTITNTVGDLAKIPAPDRVIQDRKVVGDRASRLVKLYTSDWDGSETSWEFRTFPLIARAKNQTTLQAAYKDLRMEEVALIDEAKKLEELNNVVFIDAFDLQGEISPVVPIWEITLNRNPSYRYGSSKSEIELELLILNETIREMVSFAIGCMFGRYSLDVPGLILANQGDSLREYLAKVPSPTFHPNHDPIIPLLDDSVFENDATLRFEEFLRLTFGGNRFSENLAFVQSTLGKDIRNFFQRGFFPDHLKRYKNRPIYWLFSSGPERAFQCLVYLHRLDERTLGRMRTEYVHKLQNSLTERIKDNDARISSLSSTSARVKLQKQQDTLKRQFKELHDFEERLAHAVEQKIMLDLDDGVKLNYAKFGDLLAESQAIIGAGDDE